MSSHTEPQTDPALTEFLQDSMPLCRLLDVQGIRHSPDELVMALDWRPELRTLGQAVHGGALMALADTAGASVAFSNLPEGAVGTSTIESKTNFLGAVTEGRVVATARPLHVGGTTIVVEVELHVGDRLVGKTVQTQIVLQAATT